MDLFDLAAVLRLDTSQYERSLAQAEKQGREAVGHVSGGRVIGGIFGGLEKVGSVAFTGITKAAGLAVSAVQTIGKAAIVAAGGMTALGAAFAPMVKKAVSAYSSYEQLVGGVETLFKDNAALVIQDAKRAYRTAGMSANQYMETVTSFAASMLQGVGGDTMRAAELSNRAVTDMADNANKFGTDMESVQNAYRGFSKQNFTMLDNLKLGYGGTRSEMERLLREANEINRQQGHATNYTINNFADIVNAIHDVQTAMGVTGTTAEEASTTIQGSAAAARAAWTNMLTTIASPNSARSTPRSVQEFVDAAETYLDNLIPAAKRAIAGVGVVVQELSPYLSTEIPKLITDVLPTIIDTGIDIGFALMEGIAQIVSTTDWVALFRRAKNRVKLNLATLLGVNANDYSLTDLIVQALDRVYNRITSFFSDPRNNQRITNFFRSLIEGFARVIGDPNLWDALLTVGQSLVNSVFQAFAGADLSQTPLIESIRNGLVSMLRGLDLFDENGEIHMPGWLHDLADALHLIDDDGNLQAPEWITRLINGIEGIITSLGFVDAEGKIQLPEWLHEGLDFLSTLLETIASFTELISRVINLVHPDQAARAKAEQAEALGVNLFDETMGLLNPGSRLNTDPELREVRNEGIRNLFRAVLGAPLLNDAANAYREAHPQVNSIGSNSEGYVRSPGRQRQRDAYAAEQESIQAGRANVETPSASVEADTVTLHNPTMHISIPRTMGGTPYITEAADGPYHPSMRLSHAKGLWDVPYNDYYARLHRDEMVLTASQARQYREGTGNDAIVAAIDGLRNDLQNLKIVVGKKIFGETVVDYSGKRMRGYIGQAENKTYAGYGWG